MTKNGGILDGLVVGWFGIEPIILGCVAAKQHFILRSRHGASKTMFAKLTAQAIGGNYRHYDATKDDMVSVAGIPNPESLKNGTLEFSRHDRSIWDADYISIDELSRAPRESQNMWLEILEERTCFGFPLKYRMAIATMNPETYNATYRVDEALLDRFTAVIEVPDVLSGDGKAKNKDVKDVIRQIVKLNMNGHRGTRDPQKLTVLGQAIQEIESHYQSFVASDTVVQALQDYTADFGYELGVNMHKGAEVYISPRRYILLANCIAACSAYYKHAQNIGLLSTKEGVFVDGAEIAVMYVFSTALGLDPNVVSACHQKAKGVLKNIIGSESDKLRYDIQMAKSPDAKVRLLKNNMNIITRWTPAEATSMLQMVSSSLVEATRDGWANASTGDKKTIGDIVANANAIDELRSLFASYSGSNAPSIVRVVVENVNGNLTCNIASLLNDIAQDQISKNNKKQSIAVTFDRVKNAQNASPLYREMWGGKLINGSVSETLKTVLNTPKTA